MNAEIIAIGSELLTPFRQDTNSLYLTSRLNELGVEVRFKTLVGDRRSDLTNAAQTALARSDIVIFMGGLGPTQDDLTRECVAEALGRPLRRNQEILAGLRARFAARGWKMTANNEQQADVIEGAEALPNSRGSAPGQFVHVKDTGGEAIVILLPGPPHELKAMFEEECLYRLRRLTPPNHIATRLLKIAMIGESAADSRAAAIYKPRSDVETTILAGTPGEVQLHLTARAGSQEEAQKRVDSLAAALEDEFEDAMFSTQGETLEQIAGYYLQMRGATLAVAESCTGGLLAERITSVPGSSRYFLGGAIVYDNSLKTALADVPPLLIQEHGAVSAQVATALAEGIRKRCKATVGVGITGVAGPTGGTEQKPVGLVYVAVSDESKTDVVERKYPGDRDRIRHWASQQALDMVRRRLM
ncbi:MAG TPA: competence/damage-inducible protein A [Candidatus Limnocylindrales bacterium]|nr:competence/damage-inducible protein A [Candidatus Limnocylindrales bacterium]